MAKRDSNEESLGTAIERLLKVYRLDKRMNEASVINNWSKLMGPMVTRHTREIFLKNGKLHVRLDSSVLRAELEHGKQKIIDMLNKEAGEEVVTSVYLK